jgi:hypothetical protein
MCEKTLPLQSLKRVRDGGYKRLWLIIERKHITWGTLTQLPDLLHHLFFFCRQFHHTSTFIYIMTAQSKALFLDHPNISSFF